MSEKFRPILEPEKQKPQSPVEAGTAGPLGIPPPAEHPAQDGGGRSPERQRRTRIVYNPKKETFEEYKKRYDQALEQRREKERKYQREYHRRWRQARKQQREADLTQPEQKEPEAI